MQTLFYCTNNCKRLSLKERVIIQTLLEENISKSFIANKLSRSTITREIKKWIIKPSDKYDASLADWNAKDDYPNKRNKDKINIFFRLKIYVYKGLLKGWSPEQIAGRIKKDYPKDTVMTISYETIYTHIYSHKQAKLNKKLIKLLPYQKSLRIRACETTKRGSKILESFY